MRAWLTVKSWVKAESLEGVLLARLINSVVIFLDANFFFPVISKQDWYGSTLRLLWGRADDWDRQKHNNFGKCFPSNN
jgi:hypothetical protein